MINSTRTQPKNLKSYQCTSLI